MPASHRMARYTSRSRRHHVAADDDHHHLHGERHQRPEAFAAGNGELRRTLTQQQTGQEHHHDSDERKHQRVREPAFAPIGEGKAASGNRPFTAIPRFVRDSIRTWRGSHTCPRFAVMMNYSAKNAIHLRGMALAPVEVLPAGERAQVSRGQLPRLLQLSVKLTRGTTEYPGYRRQNRSYSSGEVVPLFCGVRYSTPLFITKVTRLSTLMSLVGSPGTAITSAK